MTKTNITLVAILIILISGALGFTGGYYLNQQTKTETTQNIQTEDEFDVESVKSKLPNNYKIYTEDELNDIVQKAIADRQLDSNTQENNQDFITPN
jgi:hypothetical protein